MHIPTQPNGWDCGFYVMKTIQMLVEEFILGWISPEFVSRFANGCLMWILLDLVLIHICSQGIEMWFTQYDVDSLRFQVASWARWVLGF